MYTLDDTFLRDPNTNSRALYINGLYNYLLFFSRFPADPPVGFTYMNANKLKMWRRHFSTERCFHRGLAKHFSSQDYRSTFNREKTPRKGMYAGIPDFSGVGFYAQTPENMETVSIQALNRGHVLSCCPQNKS